MATNPSIVSRVDHAGSNSTIGVVTDASADVPAVERHDMRWDVVPETWQVEGHEITDTGEASRRLIRSLLRDDAAVVSTPRPEHFTRAYEKQLAAGAAHVWSIHASREFSDAVLQAREAAADDPQVSVVETGVASIGAGLLACRVLQLSASGCTQTEIADYVQRHAHAVRFLVVPDHFDPAGGRRMMVDRLLAGTPMLSAADGRVTRSRRLRSRRATVAAIQQHLHAHAPADATIHMAIGHGDAAGAVDPFLDIIERIRPHASIELVGRIGPRVVQQLGARCVGLAWIVE